MKCFRCNLVNAINTDICKRCYTPLVKKSQNSDQLVGGIYSDNNLLVIELRANLPKRCYKCNSANVVANRIQNLEYTPLIEKTLEFAVGQVIPIPLPITPNRKTIGLDLSFCHQHRGLKRLLIKGGYGTLVLSLLCFIFGLILKDSPEAFVYLTIASVIIFCVGLLVLYGASEYETVKFDNYRNSYFWVKGFGEQYLKSFPKLADVQKNR